MSRTELAVIRFAAAVYVLAFLACVGAFELELVDDDGDIGGRWRGFGAT